MARIPLPKIMQRRLRRPLGEGPWRYVRQPERLRRQTLVTLLRSCGETFPAMLAAIRGARRQIHFETYILRADRVGTEFRDALTLRARARVAVRLLYDAVGSIGLADSFMGPLRAAGAEVAVFHPIAPWRRAWGLGGSGA